MSFAEIIVQRVKQLPPGARIEFDRHIAAREFHEPYLHPFKWPDWVLEQIMGSAYEYSWEHDRLSDRIIFNRRSTPLRGNDGLRTYVSPDRAHYYLQNAQGLFAPIVQPAHAAR